VICANCGAANSAGRKFCGECGTALAVMCSNCGAANEPGVKFCGECGFALAAEGGAARTPASGQPTATPTQAQPSAERRLVSVLFADLVGFTTLSESRDSEEVRELLTRYFDTARRFVGLYGGTVEKFIGDAVMAVWGTPVAQEDDAERAVRAALDLVRAVSDLGEEVGAPDLRARAGVLTGEAAVTLGAEGQGMVAGDLVNTASRIQSAATPGSVFVGDATRRPTEAAIVYEDAGEHELKGKAEPVRLSRAVRVVAGTGGGLRSTGLEAPFVGRDRELKTVKDLFFAVGEDRKAQLVSIIGIGGIGKSRLAWEFYKYFDGLPQITWYHRGRCLSYGEGVAYWALAEMVRMRARIAEGEDQASAAAKLHATVEEHITDPEERKWVEPRLAHLIGLEERTARDREDLFAAWRLFFERLAEQNPCVMVFEDMHWADAALLDFIEYLMEWSKNHPIYVLVLARPDLLDRRPTWGSAKRNFSTVYLEPLPAEAMEALLSDLVPGLPVEVRSQILERAEGVPLYAVETVRMLLDRGLLTEEENVYRPTGPIDSLEVPETLQALIAARLDGLTAEERRVIQDASVLGKAFFKEALAAVGGVSDAELEPVLSGLVRKEVLSIQADLRSPERGQYGFLQDLVRKVAYDTLAKKERKTKHLAVATYLERTWGEDDGEIAEVLASHYGDAYRAAPDAPDAAELKAKARHSLTRAGEWAASLAASEEAQRDFEQAIELADEPLEQAELHEKAGRMAHRGTRAPEAEEHFERAIALFDSIGLTHPAARVSAALGEVMWDTGRIDEGVGRMTKAFDVLSQDEPDADFATLAAQFARFLYFSGHPDEAAEKVDLALTLAEALQLPEVYAEGLNTKSVVLMSRGRRQESLLLLEESLRVALEHSLSAAALRAYNNLGAFMNYSDRHEEELASTEGGLEHSRRVGDHRWELGFLVGRTTPLLFLGRWDDLVASVQRLHDSGDFKSVQGVAGTELIVAASVHVERGELDEARSWLEPYRGAEASHDIQLRTVFLWMTARILRAEGRDREALARAEEAFRARDELGIFNQLVKDAMVEVLEAAFDLGDEAKIDEFLGIIENLRPGEATPYLQAQGARFGARLSALRDEDEKVEPGFRAAEELFRYIQVPFFLAVSLLEHGEWLIGQGRAAEAEPQFSEAQGIFQELHARPWLERLERAVPAAAVEPVPAGP
jgi:class 3 adenylate cyclase/tetratricopeptide (TPR) repeat protein